jgi:uncharacterized protein YbbC (DUF1343 family)
MEEILTMPPAPATKTGQVITGLESLCLAPPAELKTARLGLLCNQACGLADLTPSPEAIARSLPNALKAMFGPQHGFFGDKQDNMVESDHGLHPRLQVPVHSLYGQSRRPAPEMLEDLDVLLIDLIDVGCRVYTFATTTLYCLEQAARAGVSVWVLDRPNPLGRGEEGSILPESLESFVGPHAIPLRHGLSLGELCLLMAAERNIPVDLKIIPCEGWQGQDLAASGMDWIMPSPNLPTLEGCRVYPGQVLLEGTTLSEGRGTTRPFEIFGAPGLDPYAVADAVEKGALAGASLRPLFFEPTFHKHAGQTCGGFQIHIVDPAAYRPVRASLALLSAINRVHPGLWDFRPPPYEYENERRPLDLLLGDAEAADLLQAGTPAAEILPRWEQGLQEWRDRAATHEIY